MAALASSSERVPLCLCARAALSERSNIKRRRWVCRRRLIVIAARIRRKVRGNREQRTAAGRAHRMISARQCPGPEVNQFLSS